MYFLEGEMIILYFLLIASWGYGIARFLLHSKDTRFFIFFPVGLALTGLISTQLWFAGFRFQWTSLAIQAIGWTLLPLLISDIWLRVRKRKWNQRKTFANLVTQLNKLSFSFFDLPWLVILGMSAFSLLVLTLWTWNVFPIHWDSLSLYDYRALRILEGWQRSEFMVSELAHPILHAYDWHHPWFSSVSSALAYAFGVQNVNPLNWFLAGSVIWHAVATWKSWRTRSIFIGGLSLMPAFFIGFTESYAIIPATLFWGHFFLITQKVKTLDVKSAVYCALFAGAAMQCRIVEPFWFPIAVWFAWQYRKQLPIALVVSLSMALWQLEWSILLRLTQNALLVSQERRSATYGLLNQGLKGLSVMNVISFAKTFLSSSAAQLSILVFGLHLKFENKTTVWWRSTTLLLFLCLVILLGGMSVFAFSNPTGWLDIRLALPRASMPLFILALILLADLFQQSEDSSRMQ
jgi:hypothetical protein